MDNLQAVLAGGPPRDDELALRPSKRTCHDWQLALRNRKVAMLFTLLRLVRKAYNPEARGDCAWIAIQCSPEKNIPFWQKLGAASSTSRFEKITWLRELGLDFLSGKPVRRGNEELADGEQLSARNPWRQMGRRWDDDFLIGADASDSASDA